MKQKNDIRIKETNTQHDIYRNSPEQPGSITARPSVVQLEAELIRARRRHDIKKSILSTVGILIVIAAAITLVLTLWLPIVQVQRGSMAPTLREGEVLVFFSTGNIKRGDIIAFYHGSRILIKRVVAISGDRVDIDSDGTVLLNNIALDEPYVIGQTYDDHTLELPCLIHDNQFFILGDYRQTSLDSRSAEIGLVNIDQIIGKALFRIWPLDKIGVF